ncbi:MAG: UDP-N-acetylglucosamine--N-acetylmuramyl-(pentapeptide) pyrophosphoryl-undecaprenol N-acetylglucosamine transferase [Actinobacteria bacterium]|nr:UDP-N-acetylglucosamine--N-acetylmuramyl-(pentapeptide) pyrophosphoryl-undecaprenol N-acetylglucosamine transferase [Actinomycetota bacterium]
MSFVMAAAGTGGHVYPALAVADALVSRGVDPSDIVFFGGDRMAEQAAPAAGYQFVGFGLPRLRRSATPSNLAIPWRLRQAAAAMGAEMERRRAAVVLGTSGYATVPAAMAAAKAGIPMFLQEQNASPGLAARFAARRATATFLGLPGPSERLPRSRIVGNPLRAAFERFDRASLRRAAKARYGVADDAVVIGVLGGSLGARVLNESVAGIVAAWRGGPMEVVHLTGRAAFADMSRAAARSPLPWRCIAFEDAMEHFYAAADVVVCRAGAMTISELAATGTPAVLVPLEAVGQQANAAALAGTGGAVVLPQAETARLPETAVALAVDLVRLAEMTAGSLRMARPGAAGDVAAAMLEAAHG